MNNQNFDKMSGWFDIGAAAVGGAAGLLGRIGQKRREKRQLNYQKDLMGLQKEHQMMLNEQGQELAMQTWRDTNYPAQMEMMQKAGLNPALMYGGSGAGGTTSSGSGGGAAGGSAPNVQHPYLDISSSIAAAKTAAEIKLLEANARKADKEGDKIAGVDTQEAESRIAFNLQNIKNKQAEEHLTKVNAHLGELQGQLQEASLEDQIDRYQWESKRAMYEADQASSNAYVDRNTREERIGIIAAQEKTSILAAGLMKAQSSLTWEQARKTANDILMDQGMLRVATRNSITNQDAVYWKADQDTYTRTRDRLDRELERYKLDQTDRQMLINGILGGAGKMPSTNNYNYNGPGPQR